MAKKEKETHARLAVTSQTATVAGATRVKCWGGVGKAGSLWVKVWEKQGLRSVWCQVRLGSWNVCPARRVPPSSRRACGLTRDLSLPLISTVSLPSTCNCRPLAPPCASAQPRPLSNVNCAFLWGTRGEAVIVQSVYVGSRFPATSFFQVSRRAAGSGELWPSAVPPSCAMGRSTCSSHPTLV